MCTLRKLSNIKISSTLNWNLFSNILNIHWKIGEHNDVIGFHYLNSQFNENCMVRKQLNKISVLNSKLNFNKHMHAYITIDKSKGKEDFKLFVCLWLRQLK